LDKSEQLKFWDPLYPLGGYSGRDRHLGKNQTLGHFQCIDPAIVKTFDHRTEDPFLFQKNDPRLSGDQPSPVLAKKTPDSSEDMLGYPQVFREQTDFAARTPRKSCSHTRLNQFLAHLFFISHVPRP
jgi:hypothetical protein